MQIKSNLSYHSLISSSLSQLIVSGSGALNLEHSVTVGHRLSWMTKCTSGRDTCNPQSCSDMPTWAVPEQRRFSLTHSLCGRSAPDGNDGLGSGHAERMRGGPLLMSSIHATFGWKSSASRCAVWWLKGCQDLNIICSPSKMAADIW